MRAIDADALIPMMRYATIDNEIGIFPIKIGFDAIKKVIDEQPTIEPERKKGKWIHEIKHHKSEEQEFDYYEIRCSECGVMKKIGWHGANYCPNCGSYNGGDEQE